MRIVTNKAPKFIALSNQSPIEAKISDHNIIINDNTLFFNMMMQGRWSHEKKRYNNGFGLIESDLDYQRRIRLVVQLLAETLSLNPQINIIGLAEAPIRYEDIIIFINEFQKYPSLTRFKASLVPEMFTDMGVATFIDGEKFDITKINREQSEMDPSLQGRLQEFLLTEKAISAQFRLFNLHLPYDLAKSKDSVKLIRFARRLFQNQHQVPVVVIGDFNIYPKIIAKKLTSISFYIQKPNNLLVKNDLKGRIVGYELDCVDGILKTSTLDSHTNIPYVDSTVLPSLGINIKLEFQMLKTFLSSKFGLFANLRKKESDLSDEKLLLAYS